MHRRTLDREHATIEYGVPSQRNFPWPGVVDAPFGSMWVMLAEGMETDVDQHADEEEVLVVMSGGGVLRIDGEDSNVHTGDISYIPAGSEHTVRNDGSEELVGLHIWWPRTTPATAP